MDKYKNTTRTIDHPTNFHGPKNVLHLCQQQGHRQEEVLRILQLLVLEGTSSAKTVALRSALVRHTAVGTGTLGRSTNVQSGSQ
jgi:hypothetical protein